MLKEFKEFALQGNVMDLAVGVIIGAAFKSIIDALVDNIIMPLISIFTGGLNFDKWVLNLPNGAKMSYGTFISAVINFIIIAFVIQTQKLSCISDFFSSSSLFLLLPM